MDIFKVILSKQVERDIKRVPLHIKIKLAAWVDDVGYSGLSEVRKTPGYHDEPLRGKRKGQRSIRLSKQYRAIYKINDSRRAVFVEILEVNKHEY